MKEIARKRRLKQKKVAAYSLSDDWVQEYTSGNDVKGTFLRKNCAFCDNFDDKNDQFSAKIDENCDFLENKSQLFSKFSSKSKAISSKFAYISLIPLAAEIVTSTLVFPSQKQDAQSGRIPECLSESDVKPTCEATISPAYLSELEYKLWSKGLLGSLNRLCYPVKRLVTSVYFNLFMTICVVLNTIALTIYHYGMNSGLSQALDEVNLAFTVLFAAEMVLKQVGLGVVGYFRSKMNVFDCVVVVISLLELSLLSGSGMSALRSVRILRVFRVMRVARLFRYLTYMRELLTAIEKSVANMMNMALLILLFLVVVSLFGMQLFGGKFDFPNSPRGNYDDFQHAFLTSFQILTMENWFEVLYAGMRTNLGYFAALYFVIWVFFGNFVLLNLFLAIILNGFTENESDEFEYHTITMAEESNSSLSRQSTLRGRRRRKLNDLMKKIEAIRAEDSLESGSASASVDPMHVHGKEHRKLFEGNECEKSWGLFRKTSVIRMWCFQVTSSSRFEWAVLGVILLSTVKLIWETYIQDESPDSPSLYLSTCLDLSFTCLFSLEFLLKATSLGLLCGKGTYMRDCWNLLDLTIITFSLLDLSVSDINIPVIKVFRLLRALRPLRFISHNESMRIIVNALIESIGALANVAVVFCLFLLIFAILGVTLMSGKMYKCSDPRVETQEMCEYYGLNWENSPYHYDNVLSAYLALFALTSQENWPDQMYHGVDSCGSQIAMQTDCSPFLAYFFIIYMVIGSIFFLNLLLAVMFDKFEKAKRTYSPISELILKNEQLRWVELMKYIIRTKRKRQRKALASPTRLLLQRVISHWSFNTAIMVAIVGNMVVMAIAYDQASPLYTSILEGINLVFTCVFVLEAGLKMWGLTVKGYFEDRWNRFDFFLVVAPFFDLVLTLTILQDSSSRMMSVGPQLARVLRILRVSRLLRLIKRLKMIDDLVGMLSLSLPAIFNVFMLLLLVFMMYGVLGVFLFHDVTTGQVVDDYNNFSDFHNAVLVLIRASTGEDWNYLLTDLSTHTNPYQSTLFMLSFVSLTTFIMYNMFIMVMLQEFESYNSNPDSSFRLYKEHLALFNSAWNSCVTTENKARIDIDGLIEFAKMTGVIELREHASKYEAREELGKKGFLVDGQGFLYYHDALFRFFRVKCGLNKRPTNKIYRKLLEKEEQIHTRKLRKLIKLDKIEAAATYMHRSEGKEDATMEFFDLVFLKSIFRSWKGYSQRHKDDSEMSDTPAMSFNHPGCNTPRSVSEEGKGEQGDSNPPQKISRMSTTWTKQRPDSGE